MKDQVYKVVKGIPIWTKNKYLNFIKIIIKFEVEKKVLLRLANSKKDKKEQKIF